MSDIVWDFQIGQGDRLPALEARLESASGALVNLLDATVTFRMMDALTHTPVALTGEVDVTWPQLDADDPTVTYQWGEGDTDTHGHFLGEWYVTWAGDFDLTVPNEEDEYIQIHIKETVAEIAP